MRVLISVDMEGIAGVTGHDDVAPGTAQYERFRRLMTAEANAAVSGAFAAGAKSVVVNDSHDGMRNILYEELDARAELISGYNKPLCMVQGAAGAQAAVFIGYHAMAGTARAVLDHTISGAQTHNWYLNGVRVGEAQLNAALCGHFDVPVVAVSGDDKLAVQVQATLPGARSIVVKESLDREAARNLPRGQVLEMIATEVAAAVRDCAKVTPLRAPGVATIRVEFSRAGLADLAGLLPEAKRIDDRTLEVAGANVVEAWRRADVMLRLCGSGH